jgi:hypothetical protein
VEVTSQGLQLCQEAGEILHAAAETVDGPGRNHVDPPRRGILEHAIKSRPLVAAFGAADAGVFVDVDDLPAGARRDRLQLAPLVLGAPK